MTLPAALRRLAAAGLFCLAPAMVPAQPAPATVPSTAPAAVPASAPASASASAARPAASVPAPAHAARRADCPPLPKPLDPAGIPQALQKARDRGLLWRVEKDGRTSWLYGTVHAARRGWMLPGPTVMAAVRASDRVALEMDLLDPTVVQKLQAALRKPADAPPLPPDLERRLAAQRDAACADPSVQQMRPELQVSSLVVMSARREGFDPAYGIDVVLAGLARGLHKPVVSLESVELQVQTLASDDPKENRGRRRLRPRPVGKPFRARDPHHARHGLVRRARQPAGNLRPVVRLPAHPRRAPGLRAAGGGAQPGNGARHRGRAPRGP